jgi:plastocyanin
MSANHGRVPPGLTTMLLALAAACGSSSSPSGPPAPAIQKTATASGDGQTAPVTTALPNPLRVVVTVSGTAKPGETVAWAAPGTGASVAPTSSVTDASGIATTTWTLGQTAGAQTATATLSGATGSPVSFGATGAAGAPMQLLLSSGDNQAASLNSTLPNPLTVKVADTYGNGVSSVSVTWQGFGGAMVNPTSSMSDVSGIAQTVATVGGTPGTDSVTATSSGLTGSPVKFHATAANFPTTASVSVGDDFFKSARNATQNPAVDTIAAGGTVTWTWVGMIGHSVQSTGSPMFTSSTIKTSGTYMITFTSTGNYTYNCSVHPTIMTGTIVVK